MQWTTLAATLLGAAIATGSALLVEVRRGRRETAAEWRTTKRELYAAFLATLTQVRSELWMITRDTSLSVPERTKTARQAFARCYELRYQLEVFAPREVVEPALAYFRSVRRLRDAVANGLLHQQPACADHDEQVMTALSHVRNSMRLDMKTDTMTD
jgi:hypothetical protein